MRTLEITAVVRSDMDRYRRRHPRAMRSIAVRLQEIGANPSLLAKLLKPGSGGDRWMDDFYVGEWAEQRKLGKNLSYLKVWEIENAGEKFRVIYAHNPRTDIVHVLGIASREFDYDPDHQFTKRVIADYDKLGCPLSN